MSFNINSIGQAAVDVISSVFNGNGAASFKMGNNSNRFAAVASERKKERIEFIVIGFDFSDDIFKDLSDKDTDYLKLFKLISMLCFDIYLKKQLIESVIDTLEEPLSKAEKEKLAKKELEAREKRLKKEREEREKFKK